MKIAAVSLDNLISYGVELFAIQELALQDEIALTLKKGLHLEPRDLVLVVAVDEVTPVASVEATGITLRYNGRFYPPKRQDDGSEIGFDAEEWASRTNAALNSLGFKFEVGDIEEVIKFTLFVPAITINPAAQIKPEPEAPEEPAAEEPAPDEEPAAEEPAPDEEPAAEEPAPDEKPEPEAPEEEPAEEPEPPKETEKPAEEKK